jgi:predicted nucleotidyltransferase
MISKKDEIMLIFAKSPWKKYSFSELKKISKKKSNSYLQKVIRELIKDNLIISEKIEHISIYSLNISSSKAKSYAGFVLESHAWNKEHVPKQDIQNLMNRINYKSYVFLITGSYANGTQTKKSDIDVVILIESGLEPKKIHSELKLASKLNIPNVHLYVFTYSEFRDMILNKEVNYGKEIIKNNLIFAGGQIFLEIIKEAMENGFNERVLN